MAEYIEREATIEGMWDGLIDGSICGPEDTEAYLRKIPAADVAPVRYGRWLLAHPGEWTAVMECSECGRRISIDPRAGDIEKDYPYCHCGAKMDGEVGT